MATKKRQKQLDRKRAARKAKKNQTVKTIGLVQWPKDPSVSVPTINVPGMLKAIANDDQVVWAEFLSFLHFFELHHYIKFGNDAIRNLNDFCTCFTAAVSRESLFPSDFHGPKLIQMGHIIQHVFASSSYKDTDVSLDMSIGIKNNLGKLLALQNPRCAIQIDQKKLFDADPTLASLWFLTYMMGLSSPTSKIQKNYFRHLAAMDDRFTPPHHSVSGIYFGCTYHNQDAARRVKSIINKGIKAKGNAPVIVNEPDPKSILIVSERWHRNHAIYKSAGPLVEQLKDDYKLTLLWTKPKEKMPPTAVTEYFDKVINCYFMQNGELVLPKEVLNNDFQLVYFPDIGMSDESIWLSNLRMAPIQAVGYGHPDTTGDNNEIDYFICGDVERDADAAYSEARVCIPGLAQHPAWPTAERQNNYIDDGVVRVNCVWGPDKYNYTLLTVLAEINKAVLRINPETTHEFHFFGSPGMNRYAALPPFVKEVHNLLPNAHVHSQWEYYDYMREAEKHDFALNSFPFGCYNVLVESLWMGLPFLTLVGNRFYNRAGMWLNEQVGLDENNFSAPQAFIAKAAELITNPDELKRQREHLASIDLKDRLFALKGAHFKDAIDYIISNHPFTETKVIGEIND